MLNRWSLSYSLALDYPSPVVMLLATFAMMAFIGLGGYYFWKAENTYRMQHPNELKEAMESLGRTEPSNESSTD